MANTAINTELWSRQSALMNTMNDSQRATANQMVSQPSTWAQLTDTVGDYTGGAWGYARKYSMVDLVSDVINMSPEELADVGPSVLNQIYEALEYAIENGDADTQMYARMLLEGLGVGLQNANVDWDTFLAPLGPEVAAAFKEALGIHSPSTLTKALAPYLFDGLTVGIQ